MVNVFGRMAEVGVDASNAYSLFGARAGVAAQQLTANIDKFRELEGEVTNNKDGLDQMAETMDDTMAGAVKRVQSAWQELLLQFGNAGINDVLREIIDDTAALITKWNESGAIVEAGKKVAAVVDTIYQGFKGIAQSEIGTLLGWIAKGLMFLVSFTNPVALLVKGILRFNDAIGMTTARNMEQRADDFGNFFEEVQAKAKAATDEAGVQGVNNMLDAEMKRLKEVRKGIEDNKDIGASHRADELAQIDNQMTLLRKMQGLRKVDGKVVQDTSGRNMQERMKAQVAAAEAAAKEAKEKKLITEETIKAKEAEIERAEAMEDALKKYDKDTKRGAIDEKFKDFGKARRKFNAVLNLEGFDSQGAVEDEIDALRDKVADGKAGKGIVAEEDVERLKALIALMQDLRGLKQKVRDEAAQKKEDEADASKATMAHDKEQAILDAKLRGDEAGVKAMEREEAIAQKTAQLEKQGVADAKARATALVDAQEKLKQQQEAAAKEQVTTKGSAASAIDRIMGRSANELIAKEAGRQTALQEDAKRDRKEMKGHLETIANNQGPAVFG
jgi:hypothetical protein